MDHESFLTVGQIIQLAVAPAFLLVATGSFMNVATLRLGRVVDRARQLERALRLEEEDEEKIRHRGELSFLNRRIVSINLAVMFATFAALSVCLVVAVLFVSDMIGINASLLIALLFIVTMVMMIVGLMFFLSEIFLATRSLKVRSEYLHKE